MNIIVNAFKEGIFHYLLNPNWKLDSELSHIDDNEVIHTPKPMLSDMLDSKSEESVSQNQTGQGLKI